MTISLILLAIAASAVAVAVHQRSIIGSQRRLLIATQSLTATMTPTQFTHDLADTLNQGDDVMVSVGMRGVTVGLVSDKNTRYEPNVVGSSDVDAREERPGPTISLFEETSA